MSPQERIQKEKEQVFQQQKITLQRKNWEADDRPGLPRLFTGIRGFDEIMGGGVPKGRALLITGGTGSGKTMFLNEFIYRGITEFDQGGVFITFEERPDDIKKNVSGFGWEYADLEQAGKLAFVDASPDDLLTIEGNNYDWLEALKARISFAIESAKATRVAIDSIGTLFGRFDTFSTESKIRDGIFLLVDWLKKEGMTIFMSAEKPDTEADSSRFRIEEFVTDGVINLYTQIGQNQLIRNIIIRKVRGIDFRSGHVEFDITSSGITIYPKIPVETSVAKTDFSRRYGTGIEALDKALGGGIPQGHIVLLGGNSGTGKTTFGMHFVVEGMKRKEPCVWVALEEPIPQVKKTAESHGWDLEQMENEELLKFSHAQLLDLSPDKLLYSIVDAVQQIGAKRVVIDSVSSLESATMNSNKVREFLMQAAYFFKANGIVCIMNYLTAESFSGGSNQLLGQISTNEMRLSSIVDGIIILRYVEREQSVKKLLNILKMRGSEHVKDILQYEIGADGIRLGRRFGILD